MEEKKAERTEITTERDKLLEVINDLSTSVDDLEKRLEPILRHDDVSKDAVARKDGLVPLATDFNSASVSIDVIRNRIDSIFSRCEL